MARIEGDVKREFPIDSPHYIDQAKGLGPKKYIVEKADKTPISDDAVYMVLRLDKKGHDPVWAKACRSAAKRLAKKLKKHKHVLASELKQLVKELERA